MDLKNFYPLITFEKAHRCWVDSGKRCTFGVYIQALRSLGYRIL